MFDQNAGGRQMFQGDWECSDCGAKITELPFEPDGSRPIYCRDCHQKQRGDSGGERGGSRGPRQMFKGDWECKGCGTKITELPFEPDGSKPIFCRDCYKSQR